VRKNTNARVSARGQPARYACSLGNPVHPNVTPTELWVTFRYGSEIDATAASNNYVYQLSGNNIHKPDVTSAAGPALGNVEWSSFFTKYVVVESKVTVWITSATSTAGMVRGVLAVTCTDPSASSYQAACGIPRACWGSTTYGAPPVRLMKREAVCYTYGVSPEAVLTSDGNYDAVFSASPTSQQFYTIFVNTTSATAGVNISFEMKFKTRMFKQNLFVLTLDNGRRFTVPNIVDFPSLPPSLGETVTRSGPERSSALSAAAALSSLSTAMSDMTRLVGALSLPAEFPKDTPVVHKDA